MIHELKILPEFFTAVKKGKKTFEIRVNDRLYKVNDHLLLKEWTGDDYTGEEIKVRVKYILADENFVKKNTVAMAIEILDGCVYPSGATTEINIDYYQELERLATIGRATEKLFNKVDLVCSIKFHDKEYEEQEEQFVDTDNCYDFDSLEDLLDWSESEDNQCT